MKHQRLESVARALESLDAEALLAHYAPGFRFEDTAAGLEITSRDQLRRYFDNLFAIPQVAFRVTSMFEADGGKGGLEWVWSGSGPDGVPFDVKGSSVFELGEPGILRETIYYRPPFG